MSNQSTSKTVDTALLDFLLDPGSYPHSPEQIDHIQTHISHVFLSGPYVYKIKKPVNFEFLDYSTLEKREYYCRRELELNRRLTQDVYLDVIPVYRSGDNFNFTGESNAVAEYAVKMKRLPEQDFLHSYVEKDALTQKHLERVANRLADFYLQQEPDEHILEYGKIKNIKFNTDENFSQTEPFIGETISRPAHFAIKMYTDRYFRLREDLFQQRIDQLRIVDGHGDLHLDHIHLSPGEVQIYDCIEFNDRFRYGDLASDLAYLAMDLDFHGLWQEERFFIGRMASLLDDPGLLDIIDFYKCYRAFVKGKVKSLQSTEEEFTAEDRENFAETAARYFKLSLRYALMGSKPSVLICMGQIGSGKSTLSRQLSKNLDMPRFSSDRIRKSLAGVPLNQRTPETRRETLYTSEMSDKTYRTLQEEAEKQLKKGGSVVLDATFSSRHRRDEIKKMLDNHDVNYFFIETLASDSTIMDRLEDRDENSGITSDARIEDYEKLKGSYHRPVELGTEHKIQVDTERALPETLKQFYVKMIEHDVNGTN